MKTIKELKQQRAALDAQIAQLEARIEFVPAIGECYYIVTHLKIDQYVNDDLPADRNMFLRQEVFRTEGEAYRASQKRMAEMRIFRKLRELEGDYVPDFMVGQDNYVICYDYADGNFIVDDMPYYLQHISDKRYYSTEEACQWVIDNMEDDLKLVWGVV